MQRACVRVPAVDRRHTIDTHPPPFQLASSRMHAQPPFDDACTPASPSPHPVSHLSLHSYPPHPPFSTSHPPPCLSSFMTTLWKSDRNQTAAGEGAALQPYPPLLLSPHFPCSPGFNSLLHPIHPARSANVSGFRCQIFLLLLPLIFTRRSRPPRGRSDSLVL